jgi:uncharacterized repeat protein (TIGR01451 family)
MNTTVEPISTKDARLRARLHAALLALLTLVAAGAFSVTASLALTSSARAQDPAPNPTVPVIIIKAASAEEVQPDDVVTYTISFANPSTSTLPAANAVITDPLPSEVSFEQGSAKADRGDPLFDDASQTMIWRGLSLKPGESAQLAFRVKIKPPIDLVKCQNIIHNTAYAQLEIPGAVVGVPSLPIAIKLICPDLGDAPDSSNHFGVAMTAYPGPVLANYPTVYDPATGLPPGPRHRFPRADAWLGQRVSGERDADLFPDQDAATNLRPPADIPDRDNFDDGILRPPAVKHCTLTDMEVQVTVAAGAPTMTRYINTWIDWNRDGDWDDTYTLCPGALTSDWVVRDFATFLGPGVHAVTLPVFLPVQLANQPQRHWMRVTLSDGPAVLNANNYADGRGPIPGFKYGETEDYIAFFEPPAEPHLDMIKTADQTTVSPGGFIEYSITIINSGAGPATGVTMIDPIPAGTTYVGGSVTATAPAASYNVGLNRIEWTGNIPAGGSVVIKFKVQVSPNIDCNAVIWNRASIIDPATGQLILDATVPVKVNCDGQPILHIKKEASATSVAPGGTIEYTITIANGGTGPATGVVMYDPIPAGTSYVGGSVSATAPTATYNGGMNRIEWTGAIPAGGNVVIKFKVQVSPQIDCNVVIWNRASLIDPTGLPGLDASVPVKVDCLRPKLEIRKSANVTTVLPGGQIEFTIVVVNSGSGPAPSVLVQDPVPAGTTYVAGSLNATAPTTDDSNPNLMKWTGAIPAGGNVVIKFKVTVSPNFPCNHEIINRAVLEGPGAVNSTASASVLVICRDKPVLTITKKADPGAVAPGGTVMYTIVIVNSGSAPATGVTMIDPIPAGTTFVSGSETATAPTVAYDSGNNWVKWTGAIPAGGSVTITFKVQVNADAQCGSVIHNRASILSLDAVTPPLTAQAAVTVVCDEPKLEIHKRADVTQTVAGSQIEYTIVVVNTGSGPAIGVTVIDPVPAGTTYVAGSLTATAPTSDDTNPTQMKWTGNIPAGGNVVIKFKVTVNLGAPCQETIWNRAILFGAGVQMGSNPVPVVIICQPSAHFPDFGDAPDSDANHWGMANTAYPGPVLGRFPSVWDGTPAAQGSGPHHLNANRYWLGDRVTRERDADLMPDADGVTNILNAGAGDVADNDKADDGWLNPGAPLLDCRPTTLRVRVSRGTVPPPTTKLYLNVWIDGNRDGDWNDVGSCPQINARKFEWIVQNWTINPAAIPINGFVDFAVPTVLVLNEKPNADAWLRFTLSEQPAIPAPGPALPDGRGPAFPAAFFLGETEDYLRKGEVVGQVGQIAIDKSVQPGGPVSLGAVLTYTVVVKHVGGSAPASAIMTDVLPAGVSLLGAPIVTELVPSAAPLIASFNPGIGPSGAVIWSGSLTPNAAVQIQLRVRVKECNQLLLNRAVALNTNGGLVSAATETPVNCQPVEPKISLTKSVLTADGAQEAIEGTILPGQSAVYYLTLSSSDGLSHTVHISDVIPGGLVAVAVSASSGVANIVSGGQVVVWNGVLGPATSPVTIKIQVRPTNRVQCGQRLVNVAQWFTRTHGGQSNPVTLAMACRDLGDAPDSTNHFGAAMSAYPAVQANFPTVFDVAAPERGPRHEQPRPFHLGRGVTGEVEADQGPDMDGVTNIRPPANTPDLDKADDGLRVTTVNFKHCQISSMTVDVAIDPAAIGLLPNGIGYLNVWVDSNRNGDWKDIFQCPSATGAAGLALEHIVIDLPVNAAALGPGLHGLVVPTTAPVFWQPDLAQRPAWLRLTLSERPANKPFTAAGVQYGDGRGFDDPFRLGETEDYLLRLDSQSGVSDPWVTKRGEIWPDYDPATGQRRWMVGWIVNYGNAGPAAATNVHVIETYDPPQTLVAEHSIPFVPHSQVGNTLDYNVGTLPAGGSGIIILRTELPFNTTPGAVVRNTATVNSGNDGNTVNNTSVATVTVPLLPPILSGPLAGTTCTSTVTVVGWVQPGAMVDIYVDGNLAVAGITSASHGNGLGDFSYALTLPDGSHDIYLVARHGALTSAPSPTVTIIVDSTLFWDPISLRFTADDGHVIIPAGRLDPSGWFVFLRPGRTYTVTLRVCCADPNAQVQLEMGDLVVVLSDPDGDHIFSGVFSVPAQGRFTGVMRICVTCNLIRICTDGEVTIDPEGTVYDVLTGAPVPTALVACMQEGASAASGQSPFSLWAPSANSGQINPQTVGADGYFSFFTPPGTFRLDVSKTGYQPFTSSDIVVVDAPVHYDAPLTPIVNEAAGQQIVLTDGGVEPSVVTVAPGAVVEWINAGSAVHSSVSITPALSFPGAITAAAANGAWDSGLLDPGESYKFKFNALGTYTYRDAANPTATATVIVAEPVVQPPSQNKLFLPIVNK